MSSSYKASASPLTNSGGGGGGGVVCGVVVVGGAVVVGGVVVVAGGGVISPSSSEVLGGLSLSGSPGESSPPHADSRIIPVSNKAKSLFIFNTSTPKVKISFNYNAVAIKSQQKKQNFLYFFNKISHLLLTTRFAYVIFIVCN